MSNENTRNRLQLSRPSGKDPTGNSALPGKPTEAQIASTRGMPDITRRTAEQEKNIRDMQALGKQLDEPGGQKATVQKGNGAGQAAKPAGQMGQTRHIAHTGNWRAVAVEPDLCRIGKCVVAFNSYSILPEMRAGSPNVKARGTQVLRKGDLIKGVRANAGKNIASHTSLDQGYLAILEGHRNVTSNCLPVARHNSLCRINTDKSGAVGPLARMTTMQKPAGATSASALPPPGQRTSPLREKLKARERELLDKQIDFNASDELIRFKDLHAMADDLIGTMKAEPGSLLDYGAQGLRGGAGFVKDIGLGIGELGYEGIKAIPKTLQSRLTPSGFELNQVQNAIMLEDMRLGNITAGTIGQGALNVGKALVKPVTAPWSKGQHVEAVTRGGLEVLSLPLTWLKGGSVGRAANVVKAAEATGKGAEAVKAGGAMKSAELVAVPDAVKASTAQAAHAGIPADAADIAAAKSGTVGEVPRDGIHVKAAGDESGAGHGDGGKPADPNGNNLPADPGDPNGGFVRFTSDFDKHILERDYDVPAKRGIGGAHDLDEFMSHSKEFRVVGTIDHPTVDGIKTIQYQVAAKDAKLNLTGGFRDKIFDKTVFDPSKIAPQDFLSWGRQAAAQGQSLGPLNRTWHGTAPNGLKFMGYLDDTGAVRSFFPDF